MILAQQEGIFCGTSTAANIFIARKIARQADDSIIVTILCDRGDRYLSKL